MLENSRDLVFRNSFKDIEYALRTLNETGARMNSSATTTGHLYNLQYFFHEGLVKPPLLSKRCSDCWANWAASDDVMHMKRTADRLFGSDYRWSSWVPAGRRCRSPRWRRPWAATFAWDLEDSLWIGAGRMAESNAQQVRQVRKIIEGLGLEIATPDEAREILQLKAR